MIRTYPLEKTLKVNKRTRMFIPDSRVGEYLTRLDPFCQDANPFDGAAIFWTLLHHLDQCACGSGAPISHDMCTELRTAISLRATIYLVKNSDQIQEPQCLCVRVR